jgi:hypothetical protein
MGLNRADVNGLEKGSAGPQTHRAAGQCEMQDAETVLGVIRERGRRGLTLERLYRQLFNSQ